MGNDKPKGKVRVISLIGSMKAFEEGSIPEVLTDNIPIECDTGRDEEGNYCWFVNGEWELLNYTP